MHIWTLHILLIIVEILEFQFAEIFHSQEICPNKAEPY
jgi:hypothetical protein